MTTAAFSMHTLARTHRATRRDQRARTKTKKPCFLVFSRQIQGDRVYNNEPISFIRIIVILFQLFSSIEEDHCFLFFDFVDDCKSILPISAIRQALVYHVQST